MRNETHDFQTMQKLSVFLCLRSHSFKIRGYMASVSPSLLSVAANRLSSSLSILSLISFCSASRWLNAALMDAEVSLDFCT